MSTSVAEQRAPAYRRAPEQKQARLLAAARELFAAQGFDATSTLQIAERAGVSEGILFHHFGSKKGLLLRVAEEHARAAAAATMPEGPAQMTEESVVRNAFAFAEANPAVYDMLSKGGADLDMHELSAQGDVLIDAIRRNLERGMRDGRVRRGDPDIMARLQFAVVDGAYRAWRRHRDPARREDYIHEAVTCMKVMLNPVPTANANNSKRRHNHE